MENICKSIVWSSCFGTDYSDRSDLNLVTLMCDGDEDAINEIIARYSTKLNVYAARYVHSVDLAKDITQEVFLKLIDKPPMVLQNDSLGPWLFRVAHNLAIDIIRRRKFEQTGDALPDVPSSCQSPYASASKRNDSQVLRGMIDRLSDDLREVVELRIYAEMPFKDIAELLSIPQGTALWRMHEAGRQLRMMISQVEQGAAQK